MTSLVSSLIGSIRRVHDRIRPDTGDKFLSDVRGVIHVGANSGQERDAYRGRGLHVLWIEPIPEVFARLQQNIAEYPDQRAIQALVTDRDDVSVPFHISNNEGASSSVFDFGLHKDIWPSVEYAGELVLQSVTLASLANRNAIDLGLYDALVLDTQGSELLVLKGAEPMLDNFRYVKTEVADFESYVGCCQLKDIEGFLTPRGFREVVRREFAAHPDGGRYYDVLYRRVTRA